MKKIVYKIVLALMIIIIIINILSAANLSFFGLRIFKIGSGSMEPYLNVNDFIIIKKFSSYEVDDVVTIYINNQYITHRIIEKNGEEVIAKGDANNTQDEPIKEANIIGKVVCKIHGISFINHLLSKPISWIMLFFIGLIITILIPEKKGKGKHAK